MVDKNIFNTGKTDYETPSLFLGQEMGLLDTVNRHYPKIFDNYKLMKSLDWDENEFDFDTCKVDFKTCDKNTYEMMIRTLAWQWEADSVAARSVAPVIAPFCSSSELWVAQQRISDNESVHALTYSEIVRNSFDNPSEVLTDILSVKPSIERLNIVGDVFANAYKTSHLYALGMVPNNQDTYDKVFLMYCALLCLERIQFMSSFAVTFAIANTGLFNQIGKAVQKICQDEYEVHAEFDKIVLDYEMQTDRGLMAFNRNRDLIAKMIKETVETEFNWNKYLFSEGRELTGVTMNGLNSQVLWSAGDVYDFFRIKPEFEIPKKMPLGYMTEWMNINAIQVAPQEERNGAYMLGQVENDTADINGFGFDIE